MLRTAHGLVSCGVDLAPGPRYGAAAAGCFCCRSEDMLAAMINWLRHPQIH